jgi:hypothetical protein
LIILAAFILFGKNSDCESRTVAPWPPVASPSGSSSCARTSRAAPFGCLRSGSLTELRSPIPSEWAPHFQPSDKQEKVSRDRPTRKSRLRRSRFAKFAYLCRSVLLAFELTASRAWLGNGFRLEKGGGSGRRYLGLPGPRSRAPRAFLRPSGCGYLSAPILAPGFAVRCGGLRWAAPIPLAPLFGGF